MPGLRIIGGKVKGFRLKDVPGDSTRPITDMVKESLFNILSFDIEGSDVWDLFGGTGSVGLEALSRGARFVLFSDNNRHAINTLKQNIAHTGFESETKIVFGDAFSLLRQEPLKAFDYIYIAPPQYKELWKRAMLLLDEKYDHLVEDGWAIVQIHPKEYATLELQNLSLIKERKYGNTLLCFYKRTRGK
ncbi:MAG: 16S rRNA (guanine(966)-N(2))-methyltransferase RsmD [Anaerolinea sp.]|nr:16S rRNA (guanine(966)-N(2))-methyltransferase RsmD [Anaerolinea sp.]